MNRNAQTQLPEAVYSLEQIRERLRQKQFPFSGITPLGSASLSFSAPARHAGVALHSSHRVREKLLPALAVSPAERLREEDPETDLFLRSLELTVTARDSRYEYDLNRPPQKAIYRTAWGKKVWKRELTPAERKLSRDKYDEFHHLMEILAGYLIEEGGFGIVFDVHSFNCRREGERKPDINLGTKAAHRDAFGGIIERFLALLGQIRVQGKTLSVGKNEIFPGGYLTRRLTAGFGPRILVPAIEFKKIFMDEWTGEFYPEIMEELVAGFREAVEAIISQAEGLYRKQP